MDNPSSNIKSKICSKHNQSIRYYDQIRNSLCDVCILEKGQLIPIKQIQKQYQEIVINYTKENDLQIQQLQTLKEGILKYKENIIVSLNKSIQQISEIINIIQSKQQSMQQLDYIMNKYESIEEFTKYIYNNQKSNRQFNSQIVINLLLNIKSNIMNLEFLPQILGKRKQIPLQTQVNENIQKQEQISVKQQSFKKIDYELIKSVEKQSPILDFAIDQRNNTLIAGMNQGNIQIYGFLNGKVGAKIQSLQIHLIDSFCFYLMKKRQRFVAEILIQSQSIILIKEIISGTFDCTVKFWRKIWNTWRLSQTIDAYNSVYALSINQKEDKLIACTDNNQIIVMRIQKNSERKLVQKIQVKQYIYRLCFTIQDEFVFQPITLDYLEVYHYDQIKQYFCQKTKVQVQSVENCTNLFPCQYIKNLNMLIIKHGQFVNIFMVNQNGEYQLIQSIEYRYNFISGGMTDDGEYLITCDEEIQVRKLKFKDELI